MAGGKGPILAKSIRSLASLVDRSPSAVRKWLRKSNWPFKLTPPWNVTRVKAWMDIHLSPDPAEAYRRKARDAEAGVGEFRNQTPLEKAKLQVAIERALYIRQKRLAEAGKLHDVEECERRRLQQIMEVRNRLLDLPRSIVHGMVGQPVDEMERQLSAAIRAILEEFSGPSDIDAEGSGDGRQ